MTTGRSLITFLNKSVAAVAITSMVLSLVPPRVFAEEIPSEAAVPRGTAGPSEAPQTPAEGIPSALAVTPGIYVGYRWFDRPGAPEVAFPFGHGLSYTKFSYKNLAVSPAMTATGEVTAAVQVKNTGTRAGAEVAQLYIGEDHPRVDRPVKELKGYKRVFLKPGETRTVQFAICPNDLKFYDVLKHEWIAEPGTFTVYVGSSSRDIRQATKFSLVFHGRAGLRSSPTGTN